MKKKSLIVTIILLLIAVFAFSLTACNDEVGTLESLKNEYGIVVDGGSFEEGSTLVSNEIAATTEEATAVLTAIADQNYNKDGNVYIFDVYVTKDGVRVQPNGKVKVSVPVPNVQVDNYLVFHVKDDNSVEKLIPTVADGKISFETSSFSYFVIAEAAPAGHAHNFEWVEGKASTCKEEGIAPHYHCEGCGKNFDENKGEIASVALSIGSHEYGSMYWGKSANFWEDGNIEYYQCSECEKYFDEEYNEVETPVIPKYSTNLSICVNGTPTALVIGEQHENFIEWSLEGLSVTKGDVITICQTDNSEISHNFFAGGNVDTDGKILTTAATANVTLEATPNGLMLFIDGYKYEGIVIEINGVQYPMIYTSYSDETTTYIYGYVNFAVGDEFVIVDNISGTVYDYDDLDEGYLWDTWDFHRGDNGEFVIDYACRYGIEFDYGGNKKIYINKTFAPLDGSSYELNFENSENESAELLQMKFEMGSAAYEDLMWYYDHEDVVSKEDIVSYIDAKGIYVYIVKLQLEEGTKFNIKNLTANSTINAEHLVEVYTESGSITKDGDYVKALKSGYYSIVYMPCFNSIMIEKAEISSDVLMMLDGEFIYLDKDSDDMIYYEYFAAEFNTSITFLSGDGLTYYPIILDSEMDSSLLRTYEDSGISIVYFNKTGTYNLAYNVETGVLSVTSVGGDDIGGGDTEFDPSNYIYYLSVSGGSGGTQTLVMQVNPTNAKEFCYKGAELTASCFIGVIEMAKDASSSTTYGAIADTDPSIAQSYDTVAMVKIAGMYDIYFDTEAKTIKVVRSGELPEQSTTVPKDIYIRYDNILTLIENPDNPDELCYLDFEIGAFEPFNFRDANRNDITDITLAEGTTGASTNGTSIAFQVDGTFNIYINKTTHVVRIVSTSSGDEEPDSHEHAYESVVTPPTCTEDGYTTYTCGCGDSYVDDTVTATGHAYSEGICSTCGGADPDYVPDPEPTPDGTVIELVEIFGVKTPLAGEHPVTDGVYALQEGIEIVSVDWGYEDCDSTGEYTTFWMTASDVFDEEMGYYLVKIRIRALDGYYFNYFPDDEYYDMWVTLNGGSDTFQKNLTDDPYHVVDIYANLIMNSQTLEVVEVYDLDRPVPGKAPDYEVIAAGEGYTISGIYWHENIYDDEGSYVESILMDEDDVFVEGHYYDVEIVFVADEGREFASYEGSLYVRVRINGEGVYVYYVDESDVSKGICGTTGYDCYSEE